VDSPDLFDERVWEKLAVDARYDFQTFMALSPLMPRQMQRHFRKHFGCNPEEWFRRFKLRTAHCLLLRGYSTKAVVGELNFRTRNYFCREFKKVYGNSPKHFHPARAAMSRDKPGHSGTEPPSQVS